MYVQDNFMNGSKERMSLIVNKPRTNFGNRSDGNTVRRFFENYEISSEITHINS